MVRSWQERRLARVCLTGDAVCRDGSLDADLIGFIMGAGLNGGADAMQPDVAEKARKGAAQAFFGGLGFFRVRWWPSDGSSVSVSATLVPCRWYTEGGRHSSFRASIRDIEMRLLALLSVLCLASRCADCRAVDVDSGESENSVGRHRRKFTVEELLNGKFPHGISDDVDVDICKAGVLLAHNQKMYLVRIKILPPTISAIYDLGSKSTKVIGIQNRQGGRRCHGHVVEKDRVGIEKDGMAPAVKNY
ncbi:hypothetical protein WN48_01863 [Eufriesea mexicana]|uniref:Uncharacterized protein n=1 Tax=Eufriesea mexicana TaxID=516756 RepID=A0A310SPB9_9HYME|nr:hypothetical protein WN48_01863 [Eufriesea mexicana]